MRTRGQAVTRARGSCREKEGIGPDRQHGHKLLERDSELHEIDLALAGAALGRGRLIVLYGTAGVGRSSLLTAALHLASSRTFDIFSARGSAWERGYAFGVARQLLETRVAEGQGPQLRSLFDGTAAAALPALGLASA